MKMIILHDVLLMLSCIFIEMLIAQDHTLAR